MAVVTSAPSAVVNVTSTASDWRLKDVVFGSSVKLFVEKFDVKRRETQGTFTPLGGTLEVVVRDKVLGDRLSLSVMTFTNTEYNALMALLNAQRVLLLQADTGEQWYASVDADVSWAYAATGTRRARRVTWNMTETVAP